MHDENYEKMWNRFGSIKAESYLGYKFQPVHRVGLTNYLREVFILRMLNPESFDKVLDVGCASGRQLFKISKQIKQGYGVDISQSFINKALEYKNKNKILNVEFSQAVIEELPFNDGYFDKIVCSEVLEHVFNKDVALQEVLRVLRVGAILIVTVPNLNSDGTLWGKFLRFIKISKFKPLENFSKEEFYKHGDAHVREFDKNNLVNWVKENDLEVLDIKSVSFVDGPYFDFLLRILLHIFFLRALLIKIEIMLTNLGLLSGRHLIIKLRKK